MTTKKQLFVYTFLLLLICILGLAQYKKLSETKNKSANTTPIIAAKKASIKVSTKTAYNDQGLTIPILMYHHVGVYPADADATRKDLTVPAENFEEQVKWLSGQGYNSISLQQLYLYSQNKFKLPSKPIVFTFDDGYEDVFQNAVPILKKYNYTGSFAIITQWPGQTQGDNIYASWSDIKTAQSQGMEIVCHTQNHFDGTNPKFDSAYIFQNLSGCKNDLASNGITTDVLVYPYGHYTPEYISQAEKAGFKIGVTVHEGDTINLENLMEIPRVRVHGAETLQRFEDILLHKTSSSTVITLK